MRTIGRLLWLHGRFHSLPVAADDPILRQFPPHPVADEHSGWRNSDVVDKTPQDFQCAGTGAWYRCCRPVSADVGDNSGYQQAYSDWADAELALLPSAFVPGPIGAIAGLATNGIDIRLRYPPASFVAPADSTVAPNSADNCRYNFTLPQKSATYGNLSHLWDVQTLPTTGARFGTPQVGHANSTVHVSVDSALLDDWSPSATTVSIGSGEHRLTWNAETQLDPIFDVAVPTALFAYSADLKYGKAITSTDPKALRVHSPSVRSFSKMPPSPPA